MIWGEVGNAHVAELEDINAREAFVLGVFAVGVLVLGVWPKPLTDLMEPVDREAGDADRRVEALRL